MHVERRGSGAPTVLLEAGLGHHSAYWGDVPRLVAATTSVVTYDRRGLGRSPARRGRFDVPAHLADLDEVLAHCEPGPVVLVGHSFGGFLIRALAAARPRRVGALLFVDSATENELDGLPERARRLDALGPWLMLVNAGIAATGLARLPAAVRRVEREFARFEPEQRKAIVADQANPRYWLANRAELHAYAAFREHAVATRDAAVFRTVPVGVITAAAYPEAATRPLGMTPDEFRAFHLQHQSAAFAALAPQARTVVAETGHLVHLDDPELVAAEIARLVAG
ncbi:alpha/beta fold hydrolase [Pseudonocardia sp. CA-107938]|uniref:alpha/beta fold hydrolase n=1 Tax=Pseudonocardia sp. CA-107938 TaxID=3240021 RepID=UPI003D8D7CEA